MYPVNYKTTLSAWLQLDAYTVYTVGFLTNGDN